MVTRVNLLFKRMKMESASVRIISLRKKIFGKHKVFHKFADNADELIKLFSLYLIYIRVCQCIFLCKRLCIYTRKICERQR